VEHYVVVDDEWVSFRVRALSIHPSIYPSSTSTSFFPRFRRFPPFFKSFHLLLLPQTVALCSATKTTTTKYAELPSFPPLFLHDVLLDAGDGVSFFIPPRLQQQSPGALGEGKGLDAGEEQGIFQP